MRRAIASTAVAFLSLLLSAFPLARGGPQTGNRDSAERDDCQADHGAVPRYRAAGRYRTDIKPGLVLFVSINPADVTRDKLIALVCKLGIDHAKEEVLRVHIFDSSRAAKKFDPLEEGNDRRTNLSYRADYSFARSAEFAHGQFLNWRPDRDDFEHWVHIDLGPPPKLGG